MEKNFNPIRDLRSPEVDPFNVPAGQSTQEIEAIRLTLVVTREKTENLVKLLKRKGLLFKQDVEKIKELQRRLRKTIPRIPILRDDSISGSETSMSNRRRSGFDVMRGFNRRPQTTSPTTSSSSSSGSGAAQSGGASSTPAPVAAPSQTERQQTKPTKQSRSRRSSQRVPASPGASCDCQKLLLTAL
mgnify:CR=1 FL=1